MKMIDFPSKNKDFDLLPQKFNKLKKRKSGET
jgi:hypothetical protein